MRTRKNQTRFGLRPLAITAGIVASAGCPAVAAEVTPGPTELAPIRPAQVITPALSIEQAVRQAIVQYPRIVEYQQRIAAAKAGVTLQKINEYVPYGLANWQEVGASHNKLTQILFGSPAIPANPGPGRSLDTWHGTWSSAAGFLVDWAPFDFGLHRARINVARSQLNQVVSNAAVTQLDVAENAALSFLNLVVAEQQVRATEANVAHMQVFSQVAHRLVDAGLKPGADASLADAELAEARNREIEAVQNQKVAEATLTESIGQAGTTVAIDNSPMVEQSQPPVITVGVANYAAHPLALASKSIIASVIAQRQVLNKSYYPTFHWLGGINLRGAGLDIHGFYQKKDWYGLAPVHPNWNVGMMMNWNFLDIFAIRQQKVVNLHQLESERAHYAWVIQQLKTQDVQARAMVEGAIALAQNAPVELEAAREAELRSRTRYETGLATVAEVAQAEEMLMRAEVNLSIAKVGVWKALLAVSHARGDIKPFLAEVSSARTRM